MGVANFIWFSDLYQVGWSLTYASSGVMSWDQNLVGVVMLDIIGFWTCPCTSIPRIYPGHGLSTFPILFPIFQSFLCLLNKIPQVSLAFCCRSLLSHTLSFVWFQRHLSLSVSFYKPACFPLKFCGNLSRIFIKPLDHVLLPIKLVRKWGRKFNFFIFYFIFFVFHAVDYWCNVWILDLSSHKYFTSDFFFSDIEYLRLTYQPNLICFNFNSAVIVESIESV